MKRSRRSSTLEACTLSAQKDTKPDEWTINYEGALAGMFGSKNAGRFEFLVFMTE